MCAVIIVSLFIVFNRWNFSYVVDAAVTVHFTPSSKSAKVIQTKLLWRGGAKTISTSTLSVSWGQETPSEDPNSKSEQPCHFPVLQDQGHPLAQAQDQSQPVIPPAPISQEKASVDDPNSDVVMDANGLWTPGVDAPRRNSKAEDKRLRVIVKEGEGDTVAASPKSQVLVFDMSGT